MKFHPPWLKTLHNELEKAPGARLKELRGASAPFVLSLLAQTRPVAFLINDPGKTFSAAEEISAWAGADRVYPIPPRGGPLLPWPHSEDAGRTERYRALAAAREPEGLENPVFVIPPATLLQKIGGKVAVSIEISPDSTIGREDLIAKLINCGYQGAVTAYEPGEFAVRGGIIDVYPPDTRPVRIELEDDEVAGLRTYDPVSQRSVKPVDKVTLRPMAEAPLDHETRRMAASRIEETFHDEGAKAAAERIREGSATGEELARYLAFFWEKPQSILDLLPPETLVVFEEGGSLAGVIESMWEKLDREHHTHPERERLPRPEVSYMTAGELEEILESAPRVELGGPGIPGRENWPVIAVSAMDNGEIRDEIKRSLKFSDEPDSELHGALAPLLRRVENWRSLHWRVILCSPDGVSGARFEFLLREYGLEVRASTAPAGLLDAAPAPGEMSLMIAPLSGGFRMPPAGLAVITEEEIFGPRVRRYRPAPERPPDRLEDLRPDDMVVHVDHGIGKFKGIVKLSAGGMQTDCAKIEYADAANLYLPVHRMNLIEPYTADTDSPPAPDKLGGNAWAKSISRAKKAAEKIAKELVELYASRKVYEGHAFHPPDATFREFEATFPYQETPDQARAIDEVINDMTSPRPMDRLICGDVGYGKTEVALRAAFLAAMEGKQVAFLAPTTLLAHQHYRTFRQRLEPYPLRVEMVSRLRSSAQNKRVLAELREGKVDIVIGTHRLLQKDVGFRDLGLLVIDEEHRFGVKHKEKIKAMKKLVDVITLTATPIPRTLQMAFLGIWDMTVIDTPPPDRLSVRTRVLPLEDDVVRDAVKREMSRGGQVYFVTPRVQGIEKIESYIKRLAPEARVGMAHGQLNERELERVMMDFVEGNLDVLVCTSIIESGIDIPRANTVIINRAHTFGLATLYQLRGRVGRSRERAYAYLTVPGKLLVSRKARERLKALEEFSELGSGYRVAQLDLKIRGAGNILGEVQTGHIHRVGYEMYLELLQKAVRELQGEEVVEGIEPEIQLPVSAYLPEEYVPDPQDRVMLYRRISRTRTEEELLELKGELLDRFGPVPPPAENLLGVISLKNMLRAAGVSELKKEGRAIKLTFSHQAQVVPEKVVELINSGPAKYKMASDNQIMFMPEENRIGVMIYEISEILKRVTGDGTIDNLNLMSDGGTGRFPGVRDAGGET